MGEPTPITQGVILWNSERAFLKFLANKQKRTLREIFGEAYEQMADERRNWRPEMTTEGEASIRLRFLWRASPKKSEKTIRVSATALEYQLADLLKYARQDNVEYVAAYYTAISRYVEREAEKIATEQFNPLEYFRAEEGEELKVYK